MKMAAWRWKRNDIARHISLPRRCNIIASALASAAGGAQRRHRKKRHSGSERR